MVCIKKNPKFNAAFVWPHLFVIFEKFCSNMGKIKVPYFSDYFARNFSNKMGKSGQTKAALNLVFFLMHTAAYPLHVDT